VVISVIFFRAFSCSAALRMMAKLRGVGIKTAKIAE